MKKYVAKETLNKSTNQEVQSTLIDPNPEPSITESKPTQNKVNVDPKINKKQKYQQKKQQTAKQAQVQEKKQIIQKIEQTVEEKPKQKQQQTPKNHNEKRIKYKQKNEQQNDQAKKQQKPKDTDIREKRNRADRNQGRQSHRENRNQRRQQHRENRNERRQQHTENDNFKKHVRIQNKYQIHKKDVTLETPVPDQPKKILPRPNIQLFNDTLDQMKNQRNQNRTQINDLKRQQNLLIKNSFQNKKIGYQTFSKYSGQLHEKYNNKKERQQQVKLWQVKRDDTDKRIRQLQQNIEMLKHPKGMYEQWSTEALMRKKKQLEHRLSVEDLNKQGQQRIKLQIDSCTRALLNSRPQIQIYAEIKKLEDQRGIQVKNLKTIKSELWQKTKVAKQVRKQIKQIRQQQEAQKKQLPQVKTVQQIKEQYSKKIQKLQKKNQQLTKKIEQFKEKHWKQVDLYDDQQNLLNHIRIVKQRQQEIRKWEEERQLRKKKQQEEKQRRRKEKQEEQERKKRQFEERQRRRQEKRKQQQERKKMQQEKKQKLKLQRQSYINKNPHQIEIDLCNYLIKYCESLKPQNKTQINPQEKVYKQAEQADIKGKQWQKELKKGARLITSKKNQNQQEEEKKPKRQKKKKDKQQETIPHQLTFMHSGEIQTRFHKLHVLPPLNNEQIDDVIKQINNKMDIYSNPSAQQIQAFKQKASRQFDLMHGIGTQKSKRVAYREKNEGQTEVKKQQKQRYKPKKAAKVEEHQFPGIN